MTRTLATIVVLLLAPAWACAQNTLAQWVSDAQSTGYGTVETATFSETQKNGEASPGPTGLQRGEIRGVARSKAILTFTNTAGIPSLEFERASEITFRNIHFRRTTSGPIIKLWGAFNQRYSFIDCTFEGVGDAEVTGVWLGDETQAGQNSDTTCFINCDFINLRTPFKIEHFQSILTGIYYSRFTDCEMGTEIISGGDHLHLHNVYNNVPTVVWTQGGGPNTASVTIIGGRVVNPPETSGVTLIDAGRTGVQVRGFASNVSLDVGPVFRPLRPLFIPGRESVMDWTGFSGRTDLPALPTHLQTDRGIGDASQTDTAGQRINPDGTEIDFTRATDVTMCVWVKPTVSGAQQAVFGCSPQFRLETFLSLGYDGLTISGSTSRLLPNLPRNQWTHFAITKEGATNSAVEVYYDTTLVKQFEVATWGATTNGDSLFAGWPAQGDSGTFLGGLYDFRLYERALTPKQLYDVRRGFPARDTDRTVIEPDYARALNGVSEPYLVEDVEVPHRFGAIE